VAEGVVEPVAGWACVVVAAGAPRRPCVDVEGCGWLVVEGWAVVEDGVLVEGCAVVADGVGLEPVGCVWVEVVEAGALGLRCVVGELDGGVVGEGCAVVVVDGFAGVAAGGCAVVVAGGFAGVVAEGCDAVVAGGVVEPVAGWVELDVVDAGAAGCRPVVVVGAGDVGLPEVVGLADVPGCCCAWLGWLAGGLGGRAVVAGG
jgi:hypothetical protein